MCLSQHLRPDRQRPACLSKAMLLWLAGGADGNDKPEDQHCRRQRHSGAVGLSQTRPQVSHQASQRLWYMPPPHSQPRALRHTTVLFNIMSL